MTSVCFDAEQRSVDSSEPSFSKMLENGTLPISSRGLEDLESALDRKVSHFKESKSSEESAFS